MVIACAAPGPLQSEELSIWQQALHEASQLGTTFLHQEAGSGFYYVSTDSPSTSERLLFTSSHQVGTKVVFYQELVPSFNPLKPHGMLIPF
jgi:hypothetical protein